MKKLKILILLHSLGLTGAPKITINIVESLGDTFEARYVVPEEGPLASQARTTGKVDSLKYDTTLTKAVFYRLLNRTVIGDISKSISDWQPDIIYVASVAALSLLSVVDGLRAPVVLHVHELHSYLETVSADPNFTDRPVAYLAASNAVKRALTNDFGIPPDKVIVVYEFIPDKVISKTQIRQIAEISLTPRRYLIGGAGEPSLRKGVTLWLQMAANLIDTMGPENVCFAWIGLRNSLESSLFKRFACELGISEYISFVSVTDDPLRHFRNFDVFAITSIEDPCPIVVLENMLLGVPVACFSKGGGAVEEVAESGIVSDGMNGCAMAKCIADFLELTPEEKMVVSTNERRRIETIFSESSQMPIIRQVFNSALLSNKAL